MKNVYLPLLASLCVSGAVTCQEWTRFRGPGGHGIAEAPTLPKSLTKDDVVWSVEVGGAGHSSPVLFGDRVFLTRAAKASGDREVVCFDAKSGEELWAKGKSFANYRKHRFNSFASSTPVVDSKAIYTTWTSGTALFVEALGHGGKRLWRREIGAFRAQHGFGGSPVIHGDLLIVCNDNAGDDCFLLGLSKATGKRRWKLARDPSPRRTPYSCPVVYRPDGESAPCLLFTNTVHGLTAVDPVKGEMLFELDLEFGQRFVGSIGLSGRHAFLSAGSGGGGKEGAVIRLPSGSGDANGNRDGKGEGEAKANAKAKAKAKTKTKTKNEEDQSQPEIAYRPRRNLPYVPGALALDGHFYLISDGGIASCIEAKSGKSVWRERLEGTFYSSPVTNGETIYMASREGELFCVAKGEKFELHGSLDLDETIYATPAIAHGSLFVRTASRLVRIGKALK